MKTLVKDHSWVGSRQTNVGPDEELICANADKAVVIAEADDPNLSWEFDTMAIVYLRGHGYFMCQASGCSCPSPSETWGVVHRFKTKREVMKAVEDGEYKGYTLPHYAIDQVRKDLFGDESQA